MHCTFIDLEKAYDRVPREELWECLRLAEISECYIKIMKDTYDGATTTVRIKQLAPGITRLLHATDRMVNFLSRVAKSIFYN